LFDFLEKGCLKSDTLFYFIEMFISFAPPKETNQRKGGRKCQLQPFCPPATQSLIGATKKTAVRSISGFPSRKKSGMTYADQYTIQ
jgi:hypothetical protein